MIAKLNILRSAGKIGVKPREGKTINAKIVASHPTDFGVKGRQLVEANHDSAVTIVTICRKD